jgi:hypothetical protein
LLEKLHLIALVAVQPSERAEQNCTHFFQRLLFEYKFALGVAAVTTHLPSLGASLIVSIADSTLGIPVVLVNIPLQAHTTRQHLNCHLP